MRYLKTLFLPFIYVLCCWGGLFAQSNQYLHFDGDDDYVEVPNASQYLAGADGITMTGWFYNDALGYGQGLMGIRGPGSGPGDMYVIQLGNGTLECRFVNSSGALYEYLAGNGTMSAQQWQHYAWVYDNNTITLYLNGEVVGSANASGTFDVQNRSFGIGKSITAPDYGFVFSGRIDEVSLWSKGLTQAEIQDMMEDELEGDEEHLELYYKMNQGVPDGDNVIVTELISEVGGGDRNGILHNFSLTGSTSNFSGVLESSFQSIGFPQIPSKLISSPDFQLDATASSGLPVSYTLVSGPASISGNTVSLDGSEGEVVIMASQAGNAQYGPAADVEVAFHVVDPAQNLPSVDIRNPIGGDFYAPNLIPIQLASIVDIAYQDIFQVTDISFQVDGQDIPLTDHGNNHQTAWWTPNAAGEHTFTVNATHNHGFTRTETVTFNITDQIANQDVEAMTGVWVSANNAFGEAEGILPSYAGAFNQINGYLDIGCPAGGCDPWDRVSSVYVKAHNGEWYKIIHYLTPYGVACSHQIDLTDFMSLLQGKVTFRTELHTQGNGFLYSLDLNYQQGTPDYPYSKVNRLWHGTYPFGDMANLQPVESIPVVLDEHVEAARIKLVSTGHGWGENNTDNAAEFSNNTHHVAIDGVNTFTQHNWNDCDPNPDGCNPQYGTWYHNRAGWCPGSIAPFFDFDLDLNATGNSMTLDYVFDESYVDLCHISNPNCVSGVTCPDCEGALLNPTLIVTSYLITKSNSPSDETAVPTQDLDNDLSLNVFPNPAVSVFSVEWGSTEYEQVTILVTDNLGRTITQQVLDNHQDRAAVDVRGWTPGVYMVRIELDGRIGHRKVFVE